MGRAYRIVSAVLAGLLVAASFGWPGRAIPLLYVAAACVAVACGLPRRPAPVEPPWVDEDVELILEEQERRDELCPGCGKPRTEAWDISADEFERYEAELYKCHSCAAGRSAERAFTRGEAQADTDGLYTVISDTWEDGRPEVGDG